MELRRLVYGSSTPSRLDAHEVSDILRVSRRNNLADGITGVLMYVDGNVLQVIEGEVETVSRTFARIERDPRHRHIVTMLDQHVAERMFAAWSMGLIRDDMLSVDDLSAVQELCRAEVPSEGAVGHLLSAFCEMNGL